MHFTLKRKSREGGGPAGSHTDNPQRQASFFTRSVYYKDTTFP